jgi:hypothetical protein
MSSWHEGKVFLEHSLTISHDALHILVGVAVWLVLAAVLKRGIGSWLALGLLLALTLWNEAVDLSTEHWPGRAHQLGEGAKDVLLTLSVPVLLMLAARIRPGLFRPQSGRTRRP